MNDKSKGRGSLFNTQNPYSTYHLEEEEYELEPVQTKYLPVQAKTIVNQVSSPDLNFEYSLNPYQGCEHGCAYCFARPTHEYWGYSAGLDFESTILVKENAPSLLEALFTKKSYVPKTIMLSGNTDCYQPIERKLGLTRALLELALRYKNPVSIITKNALVLRDLDILSELAKHNLTYVTLSIPTLDEPLRRVMEPRTSTASNKIKTIQTLSGHGIPVHVMVAPIIPGLTSHECLSILKASSQAGARSAGYALLRLNDTVEPVFSRWIETHFPDKARKVRNLLKDCREGEVCEKRFFLRTRGSGPVAEAIAQSFALGRKKYFQDRKRPQLTTTLFDPSGGTQLRLFP